MNTVMEFRNHYLDDKRHPYVPDLERMRKKYVRLRGKMQELKQRPVWMDRVFIPLNNMHCHFKDGINPKMPRQVIRYSQLNSEQTFALLAEMEVKYFEGIEQSTFDSLGVGWFQSYFGYNGYLLSLWELGRSIYRFHPRLLKEMAEMEFPSKLPTDALMHIKDWCGFIDIPPMKIENNQDLDWDIHGAFFHYDWMQVDLKDGSTLDCPALLISPICKWTKSKSFVEMTMPYVIPLMPGKTIGDIEDIVEHRRLPEPLIGEGVKFEQNCHDVIGAQDNLLKMLLNAVLWIIVKPQDRIAQGHRGLPGIERRLKDWVIDVPKKDRIYEIGNVEAEELSRFDEVNATTRHSSGNHRSVRSHLRCGHFRAVWCGSHKNGTRYAKTMWIAPTMVRGSDPVL